MTHSVIFSPCAIRSAKQVAFISLQQANSANAEMQQRDRREGRLDLGRLVPGPEFLVTPLTRYRPDDGETICSRSSRPFPVASSVYSTGAVPAMKPEATAIGDPQDGRWKITSLFDGRRFCVPKFRYSTLQQTTRQ